MMEKNLIVAVADNGAIGRGGTMPWHLRSDLQYFKRVTMGCPVIMGRTTFESIGRPLPGRRNIVLTRRQTPMEGVTCVATMEDAYAAAEPAPRCFVIGGASVYKEVIDTMDRLFITHIHTTIPDADAYFPEINSDIWAVEARSGVLKDAGSGLEFEFVTYIRK
ncbi:MAG: dihydrofolate reductase [Bacteroidales bacterium]|nr:dihydrofolate reductase [Bacteroidales bacterium]